MNHKQRIFNMLAKKPATKLSAMRKVNMSIVDDLQSALNELYGRRSDMENAALILRNAAMELGDHSTAILALESRIERLGSQVEETLSQLGMDLSNLPGTGEEFIAIVNSDVFDNAQRYTDAVKNLDI